MYADTASGGPQPGDAATAAAEGGRGGEDLDFDRWQALGLPMALCTACAACGAGVSDFGHTALESFCITVANSVRYCGRPRRYALRALPAAPG